MFAVQCSFCQHENIPGARFCAECGSPLHLRVCPNAQCGKVSDVNAVRCEFCGTPFPKIALAEPGVAGETPPPMPPPAPQDFRTAAEAGRSDKKSAIAAWPLVVVAIVAGGLPLLWFNRSSLPTPKTWQTSPEVERLIRPPVLPAPTAQPPLPTPASAPVPAAGAESLTLPPLSAPIHPAATDKAEPAASPAATRQAPPVATNEATAETKPALREQAKVKRDTAAKPPKAAAATEPAEAARPCTEAAAALGLCDPKHAKR